MRELSLKRSINNLKKVGCHKNVTVPQYTNITDSISDWDDANDYEDEEEYDEDDEDDEDEENDDELYESFQEMIEEYNEIIENLQEENRTLKENVAKLNNKITTIETILKMQQEKINNIEDEVVNGFNYKEIVAVPIKKKSTNQIVSMKKADPSVVKSNMKKDEVIVKEENDKLDEILQMCGMNKDEVLIQDQSESIQICDNPNEFLETEPINEEIDNSSKVIHELYEKYATMATIYIENKNLANNFPGKFDSRKFYDDIKSIIIEATERTIGKLIPSEFEKNEKLQNFLGMYTNMSNKNNDLVQGAIEQIIKYPKKNKDLFKQNWWTCPKANVLREVYHYKSENKNLKGIIDSLLDKISF